MTWVKRMSFSIILIASLLVILADAKQLAAQTKAMQGFCPVTILDTGEWKKGQTELKSTYDNRTYYFVDSESKEKFDQNPPKYVPALGGDCTICLVNVGKRIAGNVFHSVKHKGRLFLFPQDRTKKAFKENPEKFEKADLAFNGDCPVNRKGGKKEAGKPVIECQSVTGADAGDNA